MAKNKKSNKKRDGAFSMEFSTDTNLPQAMDTSEATVSKPVLGVMSRKIKKAAAMKRSKNLGKKKTIEKAIFKSEHRRRKSQRAKSKYREFSLQSC